MVMESFLLCFVCKTYWVELLGDPFCVNTSGANEGYNRLRVEAEASLIAVKALSPHGKGRLLVHCHSLFPNYAKELHLLFCHLVFIFKISLRVCD